LTWVARLETAPFIASHDVQESFEGRVRGARWNDGTNVAPASTFLAPWENYWYHAWGRDPDIGQNEGVHLEGSDGSQSAFLVVTNLAGMAWSGFGLHYVFPQAWALPDNHEEWNRYSFSADFKEKNGLPHVVELQLKDANANWITFPSIQNPGTKSWTTTGATLDHFKLAQQVFDWRNIRELVVNIQMLKTDAQYVGSFDNIRFDGPDTSLGGGQVVSVYTSDNDFPGVLDLVPDAQGWQLSWTGNGVLQAADTVDGKWIDQTGAQNPLRLDGSVPRRFYRLRQP
jgi:hypothetical protein